MTMEQLTNFDLLCTLRCKMQEDGKSPNTIRKYLTDIRQYLEFAELEHMLRLDKLTLQKYRTILGEKCLPTSANSKISALNYYLKMEGQQELCLKYFKYQNAPFRLEERNLSRTEYFRLVREARRQSNDRLSLVMETMATTGIRVSELNYVTVEAVKRQQMYISNKGKSRVALLPKVLCKHLLQYARDRNIQNGQIFITESGHPLDRSNITRDMKKLCKSARVNKEKVFPHNLRHLFAVTYYNSEKDLSHLADLLGHSNLNTTRIYTSVSSAECRRQIEKMQLFVED